MALTLEDRQYLNDMERKSAATVKTVDGSVGYEAGDIIFLGLVPAECMVTDIRIIADPALDGTFDFSFIGDFPDINMQPIVTDVVTSDNMTTVINMPTSGNINADGTAYTGDRGSIWSGAKGINLGLLFNGAITKGYIRIIVTYSYFGTKGGEYGLATVPMKPYKQ